MLPCPLPSLGGFLGKSEAFWGLSALNAEREVAGRKQKKLGSRARLLATPRSTTGAGNGIRTRDPNLGKVVLYQLSYSRIGAAR